MTKTTGYKVSWTGNDGQPKSITVHTLHAARVLLNNVVLDYGVYDAKLTPVRKTFNEIIIRFDGPHTKRLK